MKKHGESGSVLWFILLAIALLAALTLTISRSSDTAEQNGSVESDRIHASEIMRYAAGLEAAIEQMRMRGISENEISFENSKAAGYANAGCAREDCKVFSTGGGGMSFMIPADANDGSDWVFTGADKIAGVGGDTNDLLMILPNVNETLCRQLNTEAGVVGAIPTEATVVDVATKFTGAFPAPAVIDEPAGKKTACFSQGGHYFFYHVLLTR